MARLRHNLGGLPLTLLPNSDARRIHANYCLIVKVEANLADMRNEILVELKAHGIGASVYYPVPLPLSKYYSAKYPPTEGDFVNAHSISQESFALPVGPHLSCAEMDTVSEILSHVLAKKS